MRENVPRRLVVSGCLILALATFTAPAAHADNARLDAAKRLYQRAELDAAMAELKAAEDSSKDDNDLVQILIYKGLIFAETGQQQAMGESFKRALAMRPWSEVPQDTSPRLSKMFHEARKEVWGSSGIKPWPKKKAGEKKTPEHPAGAPPEKAPEVTPPAQPPTDAQPVTPPAETPPASPPADAPPADAPPADAPPAPEKTPETPPADAPPDVPPTQ